MKLMSLKSMIWMFSRFLLGVLFLLGAGTYVQVQTQQANADELNPTIQLPEFKLISPDRVATLSGDEQRSWNEYLKRSEVYSIQERQVLADEIKQAGLSASRLAPANRKEFELGSKVDEKWLSLPETTLLANTILSYQTPTGGWSKAIDYSRGPRAVGTHWTGQSGSGWHYCGTLDNRSTTEQIRFLAYLHRINQDAKFIDGAHRGLQWLLDAQFPNGGWPQVYPLESGYHEAITLNDGAMLHAVQLLLEVGDGKIPFEWVEASLRTKSKEAAMKGIQCLLRVQVVLDGKPTVWCAQHDPLTLAPVAARLKEPVSLSGGESADLVKFLMREAPDSKEMRIAISAAVEWFEARKIVGLKKSKNESGKTDYILDASSNEVLWARFYDIETQQPIFAGGQDGILYSSYGEMAKHNKVGYDYFTSRPNEIITKEVERWKKRIHGQ